MNKIITLLTFFYFLYSTNAQDKLVVEYESRMEFDMEAFGKNISFGDAKVNNQEVIDALKESISKPNYYKLRLTPTESKFTYIEKIKNEQPQEGRVRIEMKPGGNGINYKNLAENLSIVAQETFNQKFLVTDSLEQYDWKISKETKEILGFETRKAECKFDSTRIAIAWYAPKLPYKNGPDKYQGLPGLILEMEIFDPTDEEKMKTIFQAISLNVDEDKNPIERPTKGKAINQADFEVFLEEQSKKFQEMYGGGVEKD